MSEISNELRVIGESLYSDEQRIGKVLGNENGKSDGFYVVRGTEVYKNYQKAGYVCDGFVRLNDGTLWKYF